MMFNMIYPFLLHVQWLLHRQGKCITIFSAPNYCDSTGNKGAVIRFGHDLKPIFDTVVVCLKLIIISLKVFLILDQVQCIMLLRCIKGMEGVYVFVCY